MVRRGPDHRVELGPFRLLHPVGRGTTATVWHAEHTTSRRPVAVKVLTHALWRDEARGGLFEREVRTLARLDHPAVIRVHDYGWVDDAAGRWGHVETGCPYIVMDWHGGGTLARPPGRLDYDALRAIMLRIMDGLAYIHARGVVHRDLKPANVLFGNDGPVISDLGTAYSLTGHAEIEKGVCGTPNYISPEQVTLAHWRFGPGTDLYALGCIGWRLTTGRPPFARKGVRETLHARLHADLPDFVPTVAVPDGFEDWLRRLLARGHLDRFRFAADAARALVALGDAPDGARRDGDRTTAPLPVEFVGASETLTLESLTWVDESVAGIGSAPEPPAGSDRAPVTPSALDDWRQPDRAPAAVLPDCGRNLARLRIPVMSGRVDVRDRLWGVLRDVIDRRCARAVCVEGPAGIGKTRLLEWLAHRAHELACADTLWIRPLDNPFHASSLWSMLARRPVKADAAVDRLAFELADAWALTPKVSETIARAAVRADPAEDGQPIIREREGFAATLEALGTLAARRPLVVVVDDAHLDEVALRFVRYAVEHAVDTPLLFVVAADVDGAGLDRTTRARLDALAGAPSAATIALGPLDPATSGDVLVHRLPLDPATRAALVRRSQGSPLYAALVLQIGLDGGWLTETSEGYRLAVPQRWPVDLVEAWTMRLEGVLARLSAEQHAALELAAVIGSPIDRAFWRAACLRAHLPPPEGLISPLLDADLVRLDADQRLALSHPLMARALKARARIGGRLGIWHAVCAELLIDGAAGASPEPEAIARHLVDADRLAASLPYWFDAIAAAQSRSALVGARTLVIAAARVCRAINAPRTGAEWVELKRYWALFASLDDASARVLRHARQGVELATRGGHLRKALELTVLESEVSIKVGDIAHAGQLLDAADRLARTLEDRTALAKNMRLRAGVQRLGGHLDRAWASVCSAVEMAAVAGHEWGWAQALNDQGDLARARGDLDASERAYRAALGVVRSPAGITVLTCNLALVEFERGDFEASRALAEEARWRAVRLAAGPLVVIADATLLLSAGALSDAAAWDASWAELELVRSMKVVEYDLARSLEMAARAAHPAMPRRAVDAARLAVRIYDRLDHPSKGRALDAWIAGLRTTDGRSG